MAIITAVNYTAMGIRKNHTVILNCRPRSPMYSLLIFGWQYKDLGDKDHYKLVIKTFSKKIFI